MSTYLDLDAAIDALQRGVDLTPPDHAELPSHLTNLGNAFLERYDLTAEPTNLDAAINVLQHGWILRGVTMPSEPTA